MYVIYILLCVSYRLLLHRYIKPPGMLCRYNSKSDIWACGCVLYELCTLKRVFEATVSPSSCLYTRETAASIVCMSVSLWLHLLYRCRCTATCTSSICQRNFLKISMQNCLRYCFWISSIPPSVDVSCLHTSTPFLICGAQTFNSSHTEL